MKRMKNNAIKGNIGHFDNEIEVAAPKQYPGTTSPQVASSSPTASGSSCSPRGDS
jgi:S-adenosylhomocysteine hydrolase